MSEFAKQAGMVTKLLSRYDGAHPIIRSQTVSLVSRLVSYATRHLALVGTYRSLPEEHLHLLATDVAQFSLAVSGMISLKLPELAKARQQCSSFKELLFYSHTVRIPSSPSLSVCVLRHNELFLLFVFVRVGDGCECIEADSAADCNGGRLCVHARAPGCGASYYYTPTRLFFLKIDLSCYIGLFCSTIRSTPQTSGFVMCDHHSSNCWLAVRAADCAGASVHCKR